MERNVLVDKLKGYACFLVLFGHVIMGIRVAGIDIPSFFWGTEKFIWSFHVALFMFLSGVVYKMTGEWKGKKTKIAFVRYKLLSLGIPYVVFSVVYILMNSFVGQTNTGSSPMDILYIWKTPIAQYWFLYALFFLFFIWTILSGILKNYLITAIVVMLGYTLPLLGVPLGSFDVVFYTALAFGLGTCLDFEFITKIPKVSKFIVIIMHVITAVLLVWYNKIEYPFVKEIMTLFGIYSSIMFISLIQDLKPVSWFLGFMNKYSFQTYLLHTIFTAGIRIVMVKAGITWWWLHIVCGILAGVIFSVVAAKIAERFKFINFFFFPTKKYKK